MTEDAGVDAMVDAMVDVDAQTALHCGGASLMIAEVDPMVSVTLFNPTDEDMDLTGTGWVLCQRPNYVQLEMIETGVIIAAHSTHTYAMPSAFVDQGDESGELALYRRSAFTNPDAMMDYICWGDGRTENRRSVADEGMHWSGPCAPPITGDTLRRRANTDGRSAMAYDPGGEAPALSCP